MEPTTGKLAMLAEVAAMFDISKHTAWLYSYKDTFPAPIDIVSAGAIWRQSDVERWGKTYLLVLVKKKGKPSVLTQRRWQPGASGSLPVGRPPKKKR